MNAQRVGIYAGAFDPVHSGHLSFALQTLQDAQLDQVYFLPERKPPHKPGAEHYGHRVAMLRQAIKHHDQLALIEVVERQFSVTRTFVQLQQTFSNYQLTLLMGADVFASIPEWQHYERLVKGVEFIVSIRSQDELRAVNTTIQLLHIPPRRVVMLDSLRPEVSSTRMRYAIRRNNYVDGLLASVEKYAKREWLYASVRQKA